MPSLFKFLSIWFSFPYHPQHPTPLCHSMLYFLLYVFSLSLMLHIYSELSQELYFICCTMLYLYSNAHINNVRKQKKKKKDLHRHNKNKTNKYCQINMHAICISCSHFVLIAKVKRYMIKLKHLLTIPCWCHV